MDEPKVKVTLRSAIEKKSSSAIVIPSAGGTLLIDFQDAETAMSVDYTKPDKLILKLEGKMKIGEVKNVELSAGTGIARDFLKNETTFDGSFEMEINKNIAVEIHGSKGSKDSSVGAGVTIRF